MCQSNAYHQHQHSFPTRRSSDLEKASAALGRKVQLGNLSLSLLSGSLSAENLSIGDDPKFSSSPMERFSADSERSEEHTSELQSRVDIVCRLLLEKKNKNINQYI